MKPGNVIFSLCTSRRPSLLQNEEMCVAENKTTKTVSLGPAEEEKAVSYPVPPVGNPKGFVLLVFGLDLDQSKGTPGKYHLSLLSNSI